jgi:hypothetical protein
MKIISQNNIPEFSLPLPVFKAVHLADAVGRDGEEGAGRAGQDRTWRLLDLWLLITLIS